MIIGMTKKGSITTIRTCAIKRPACRRSPALNFWGAQYSFSNDKRTEICFQNSVKLFNNNFFVLGYQGFPVLPLMCGHIYHHKPVFASWWSILLYHFAADKNIHRWVMVDGFFIKIGIKLASIVVAEYNIVKFQLWKFFLYPPIKNKGR